MYGVTKATIEKLRKQYPVRARVELVSMKDSYTKLAVGAKGTVTGVDDIGTIHVDWDCGGCLGVAYGVDSCRVI